MHTIKKLNDGNTVPLLGFGTWKLKGEEAYNAVKTALDVGYRHIDTASIYGNEEEVGQAIKDSGLKRDKIYVTTKLWNTDHDAVASALDKSLDRLGLEYVDLYLMHWPELTRNDAWREMVMLQKQGKVKSIGVSNFTQRHLTELLASSPVTPAVNQVEFNPFLNQIELLSYCEDQNIALEAYSPLTHAQKLQDDHLVAMAEKYSKTPAQLLLRWGIHQGIIVIPKSANPDRIRENHDIFDFTISDDDFSIMNQWNENARYCGDPDSMP